MLTCAAIAVPECQLRVMSDAARALTRETQLKQVKQKNIMHWIFRPSFAGAPPVPKAFRRGISIKFG
jgi:formyltetrahydrofolate hydrolase